MVHFFPQTFESHFLLMIAYRVNTQISRIFYSIIANLTPVKDEKVGLENFELLKVLGTGGEMLYICACNYRDAWKGCANFERVVA